MRKPKQMWAAVAILAAVLLTMSLFIGSFVPGTPKNGYMEFWTAIVSIMSLIGGTGATVVAVVAFFIENYDNSTENKS